MYNNFSQELDKLEILGNSPIKEDNNEFYKTEIINPDITIKTQDLTYSLEDRKEFKMHIDELLELLDIKEKKTAFVRELSGGQQQRVAIARALALKPAIILADEPTGNLDAKSSKEVVALLNLSQRKYKQTLILVTHDAAIASQADRIITIEDGKIVGDSNEK